MAGDLNVSRREFLALMGAAPILVGDEVDGESGCGWEFHMPVIRQTIINPLGLITTTSTYGQYPQGALSAADNIVLRNQGELWSAPGVGSSQSLGSANDKLRKLMPLDAGHVYSFGINSTFTTGLVFENGNAATFPSIGLAQPFYSPRIYPVRARDRMLVTTDNGILVGDFMQPANAGQRALRLAGLVQPLISSVALTAVTGSGAIPNNVMAGWCAIFTREFTDGYILKSVPSPVVKVLNIFANPQNFQLTISWDPTASGAVAGDFIEIYRTDGLPTTDPSADPGPVFKRVYRNALTSTDIANGFVNYTDVRAMVAPLYTTSGIELYTNPGQEGSTAANRQPDISYSQAVFKGFNFWGNIIERPQWMLNVPAGVGDTRTAAQNTDYFRQLGIGTRDGAGTVTLGSNNVTGVSATQMQGIKIGQMWIRGTGFPVNSTVATVSATSFTMSVNATANDTAFTLADAIKITVSTPSGSTTDTIRIANQGDGVMNFGLATFGVGGRSHFEVTSNQAVGTILSATAFPCDPNLTIVVEPIRPGSSPASGGAISSTLLVAATNGANYNPPVAEFTATQTVFNQTQVKNLIRWSKDSEPEHSPSKNDDFVGSGTNIQMVTTHDALWICCTDGIYRLSGEGGNWTVDLIDPGCVLVAPYCACALREIVYAYTNYGFVQITDGGVTPISFPLIRAQLPGQPFTEVADFIVEKNDTDSEVLIATGASSNTIYIYNQTRGSFSRIVNAGTGLVSVTAIAYQASPASGNAVVLFGTTESGIAPKYSPWNNTAACLNMNVAFQPFYDSDPMVIKQWNDITWIFDVGDAGKQVSAVIGGTLVGVTALKTTFNDSYGTTGVSRTYALAPTITPGFSVISGAQTKFRAISLRYSAVSNQQTRRQ